MSAGWIVLLCLGSALVGGVAVHLWWRQQIIKLVLGMFSADPRPLTERKP